MSHVQRTFFKKEISRRDLGQSSEVHDRGHNSQPSPPPFSPRGIQTDAAPVKAVKKMTRMTSLCSEDRFQPATAAAFHSTNGSGGFYLSFFPPGKGTPPYAMLARERAHLCRGRLREEKSVLIVRDVWLSARTEP